MDEFLFREYARTVRGEKAFGVISGRKYKRSSVVAGKCCDRIFAPLQYSGTTDSVLFEYWFEHLLLAEVPRDSIIVMDNAAFHRKAYLRTIARNFDCLILFLPPYSPDLNPIEHFWAWLKQKLKTLLSSHAHFNDALLAAFQLV